VEFETELDIVFVDFLHRPRTRPTG